MSLRSLIERLPPLFLGQTGNEASLALESILHQCVRGLRRLAARGAIDRLLERLTATIDALPAMTQPNPIERAVPFRLRLHIAAGWFWFGDEVALCDATCLAWEASRANLILEIGCPSESCFVACHQAGGPCGDYYWYDVTEPNGLVLDDPASTYVQLIFAGGKQTPSGTDINPYISQRVSGSQVAIDPTLGTYSSGTTTAGSCNAGCLKVSTSNVAPPAR